MADPEQARTALEYVENIRNRPCEAEAGSGTTLPVQFDHALWSQYADVAVRMSNRLSKVIVRSKNNTLSGFSEEFIYDLVRINVDDDSPIFGSAIAVEEWVFPRFRLFGPYSYKMEVAYAHDLAVNYDYLDPTSEWYHVLSMRNWTGAYVTNNIVKYRSVEEALICNYQSAYLV